MPRKGKLDSMPTFEEWIEICKKRDEEAKK